MATLRYDMNQYYSLKAVFEEILGAKSYKRLKEGGTLRDWRDECNRFLRALRVAAETTVKIADEEWRSELKEILEHGHKMLRSSAEVDELLASFSATLARVSFLQLGLVPSRRSDSKVTLRAESWKLDSFRTVQYVQTDQQRARHAQFRERRRQPEAIRRDCPPNLDDR